MSLLYNISTSISYNTLTSMSFVHVIVPATGADDAGVERHEGGGDAEGWWAAQAPARGRR